MPAAFLNYILFDKNMIYKRSGFKQISSAANFSKEHVVFGDDIVASEAGFIYCYVTMESATGAVYWDDFKVTLLESEVVQMQDFYPFGLVAQNYERVNMTSQRLKFSNKERITDLDLGWDDFGARMYMSDIGRWGTLDPKSEMYASLTPYNFTFNNPVNVMDPDGECPTCPDEAEVGGTHTYNSIQYTYGEGGTWTNGLGMTHDETWEVMSELGETIYEASDEDEKASSFSVNITVANAGKSKLQASASTSGELRLYANAAKSGKWWGLTLVGFSEKVGISFKNGELTGFSISEFDVMGVNYRLGIDPVTGDRTDQLGIAIKFSKGKIGITYRMKVENAYVPPHEKGAAGLMGAGNMRSRMTTARVYQASRGQYQYQKTEIKRTQASSKFIERMLYNSMPSQHYYEQDATKFVLKRR